MEKTANSMAKIRRIDVGISRKISDSHLTNFTGKVSRQILYLAVKGYWNFYFLLDKHTANFVG